MVWFVAVLKPFLIVWTGLKVIDDMALLVRLSRLGLATVPFPGKKRDESKAMCGLCDDVVGDLMVGSDGISVIPCNVACIGIKPCIEMCEKVKEASEETSEFPCIALGYCDAMEHGYVSSTDIDCKSGAFFSCQPSQYCRRKREGVKMRCELKPGIGRWNGMKNLASTYTAALAIGLSSQLYCSEPGAGPYCITKPKGTGLLAEWAGFGLVILWGGYKSISALETPGGNDDRQWLTFWVIYTLWLCIEGFALRVILSNIPLYYEVKFFLLCWLLFYSGAESCYRKLRRILERLLRDRSCVWSDEAIAQEGLQLMTETGGEVVQHHLEELESKHQASPVVGLRNRRKSSGIRVSWAPNRYWQYDFDLDMKDPSKMQLNTESMTNRQKLFLLSKFLLSSEGSFQLEQSRSFSETDRILLMERAAQVVSFQPRFLRVKLHGCIEGPQGELPPMDSNEKADGYVICHLVPASGMPYPPKGVQSSTCYRNLSPQWNEELEIPLEGGRLDSDGFFRSEHAHTTQLHLCVLDADAGQWSLLLYASRILLILEAVCWIIAYIDGVTDNLSVFGKWVWIFVTTVLTINFVVGYYMAVWQRSDDEPVGFCTVPLGILLDQQKHTLKLTLHPEDDESKARQNSVGGYGIIRVTLSLSET
ncbi:unnamed protein product [Cylindrotheca closterium]|uniref:C2 domain-containing protein n=1 Tax=Cylindrotheca closterium TaxID=2856 RepID=A0AAD2CUV6_9STRA|nr:unnamed protein product [Cylindrotheca closterium]